MIIVLVIKYIFLVGFRKIIYCRKTRKLVKIATNINEHETYCKHEACLLSLMTSAYQYQKDRSDDRFFTSNRIFNIKSLVIL